MAVQRSGQGHKASGAGSSGKGGREAEDDLFLPEAKENAAAELRWDTDKATGKSFVQVDFDGDGAADLHIDILNGYQFVQADFSF